MTDQLEAGPKLDALIETHVFGKIVLDEYPPDQRKLMDREILTVEAARKHYIDYNWRCIAVPVVAPYSTTTKYAWDVIGELEKDWYVALTQMGAGPDKWECFLMRRTEPYAEVEGYAEEASLAICLAALQAVAVDGKLPQWEE